MLPSSKQNLNFSSLPTVTNELAPNELQSCIAAVPIPLAPACSSMFCPCDKFPSRNKLSQQVAKTSGKEADSINDRLVGVFIA